MRCIVWRAKLSCKQTGEGLHLVATGKECEFLWISSANFGKTLSQDLKCLFPANRFKLAIASFAACFSQQWLRDTGRRVLFHDS